jgi:hypothetical protein
LDRRKRMGGEIVAEVGGMAPDAMLEDGGRKSVPLSGFWKESSLVLVFMRHLG